MKALVLGAAALAAVAVFTGAIPTARAQVQATSGLPPMQQLAAGQPGQALPTGVQPIPTKAPRYVWKGGYVRGKWRDGWVQVK